MIRRRPIPRGDYHYSPRTKPVNSLRYETILNGAVRVYRDSEGNVTREVCNDNAAGYREYTRRVRVMVQRQKFRCCLCKRRLARNDATFEHQRRRGMGAAFRDDRIEDGAGNWVNGAAHWVCNVEKG
jgi:hypothetical protein